MEGLTSDAGSAAAPSQSATMPIAAGGRRLILRRLRMAFWIILLLAVVGAAVLLRLMTAMPGRSYAGDLPAATPELGRLQNELVRHVHRLAYDLKDRHYLNREVYLAAAEYIEAELAQTGLPVERQAFPCRGQDVLNLIAEQRGTQRPQEILVIGAHYDAVVGCPAANDNGSGVAALLALAKRIAPEPLPRTMRFVAFANEEIPFFQTPEMGSFVYARRCRERGDQIIGMISLETMGYFDDEPGSQQYPWPFNLMYPASGDFIAFVGNLGSRSWVAECVGSFRRQVQFPSEGAALPPFVPQAGWSDHWAFWEHGYSALMVTDTAPFRYPYYHTPEDTFDKLDYGRFARVVAGLELVVRDLAGRN